MNLIVIYGRLIEERKPFWKLKLVSGIQLFFLLCSVLMSNHRTEQNAVNPEEPNKDKNKKKDWGLILGRKGKSIYAYQLAMAQLNSGKPITLKVLNEILAYSNILVGEDTLNSLLNMPRFIV